MSMSRLAAALTAAWLAAAGCASTTTVPSPATTAPADVTTSPGPLGPRGSAASHYVSPVPPAESAAPADSLRDAIIHEVAQAARAAGRPELIHDVRMDKAADDIARTTSHTGVPSFEAVNFFLSHYGIVEPEPATVYERGTRAAEPLAVEDLRRQLPEVLKAALWARVGVGIDRSDTELVVVLMLQERNLDLEPVPRRIAAAGGARVRGQLLGRLGQAQVFITTPAGSVRELTVARQQQRFETRFWCSDGNGRYQLEVLGTDERGPKVVANFPLFCGIDPPAQAPAPSVADVVDDGHAIDPAATERQLFALINRDRAAARVKPLAWDQRLAEVARGHSRDMVQNDFVGHVSPRAGGFADRLRRGGLAPDLVLENVSLAFSVAEVHDGLMASPGHRGNILDAQVTHVGIGVVLGKTQDGRVPLLVTQVFAAGF